MNIFEVPSIDPDEMLREEIIASLSWLADHDPNKAAELVELYLNELASERAQATPEANAA